jgi:hypothetical protein
MHDWCMVCIKIQLAHPMELLGDVGEVEDRFGLFGDGVIHGTR